MLRALLIGFAFAVVSTFPAAADASQHSPDQMQAARELLAVLELNIEQDVQQIAVKETEVFKKENPTASDAVVADYAAAFKAGFDLNGAPVRDFYASAYCDHFSTEELRQLTAFFGSDLGRKYRHAQQDLSESSHIMMIGLRLAITRARGAARAKLQEKGELP